MPELELDWNSRDKATWEQHGLTFAARLEYDDEYLANQRSAVESGDEDEADYREQAAALERGEYVVYGVSVTASLELAVPSGWVNGKDGQPVIHYQTVELGGDSVWGVVVEGRDDPYIAEVVGQCADTALYQARRVLAALREVEIPEEEAEAGDESGH